MGSHPLGRAVGHSDGAIMIGANDNVVLHWWNRVDWWKAALVAIIIPLSGILAYHFYASLVYAGADALAWLHARGWI
jgi:hypothetical protein